MRLRLKVCALGVLATPWLAIPSAAAAMPVTPGAAAAPAVAQDSPAPDGAVAACGAAAPGFARCLALIRTNRAGRAMASASPSQGYGPADLQAAYRLPATGGSGQVIAVVDAFDDPTAAADLAVYRQTYGLPACTTANGCFSKVNQAGVAGSYPPADGGWAAEISLDLDMVSAACPQCHILLVEGNSPAVSDLAASVDTAVALGASVVSNSYGTSEGNGMQQFFPDYQHPGHVIVASSGDFGYTTAQFPAVTPGVLAVGGTSLSHAGNRRGWTETVWGHGSSSGFLGGSGSGCSAYVDKPAWQQDKYCHMRTITDVSADADPQTGVAVYDTTPSRFGPPGWLVIGGTSASAPFISGVIGQAGNSATFTPGYAYAHTASFFDVTKGSNGYCGKDYLCTAKSGYDGPTGLGTPDGLGGL
jgi:subtilase family serine protease